MTTRRTVLFSIVFVASASAFNLAAGGTNASLPTAPPAVHLAGTVMYGDAARDLALISFDSADWRVFRTGSAVMGEWRVETIFVDQVVLKTDDGRRAVVAMRQMPGSRLGPVPPPASAVTEQPKDPPPPPFGRVSVPPSPQLIPSSASVQAALKEFDLPASD